MEEIYLIFKSATIAKSIAKYLGIIESTSSELRALLHEPFKSAMNNLRFAHNTSGKNQKDYLLQARQEFIRATSLEQDENLVYAYVGLAMCQFLLEDKINARLSLNNIKAIQLSSSARKKAILLDGAWNGLEGSIPRQGFPVFNPLGNVLWGGIKRMTGQKGIMEVEREKSLESCKQKCIECASMEELRSV